MLIHRGVAPADITFREGLMYYNNLEHLLEQDSAVVNRGVTGDT